MFQFEMLHYPQNLLHTLSLFLNNTSYCTEVCPQSNTLLSRLKLSKYLVMAIKTVVRIDSLDSLTITELEVEVCLLEENGCDCYKRCYNATFYCVKLHARLHWTTMEVKGHRWSQINHALILHCRFIKERRGEIIPSILRWGGWVKIAGSHLHLCCNSLVLNFSLVSLSFRVVLPWMTMGRESPTISYWPALRKIPNLWTRKSRAKDTSNHRGT